MIQNPEYVVCPCCQSGVIKGLFCTECGADLNGAETTANGPYVATAPVLPTEIIGDSYCTFSGPFEPEKRPLSDEGLMLIVNTCRKTVATVGGDGYSEIVLYLDEASGEYYLHTYSKYVYMQKEAHASYRTTPELAQKAMHFIEEHNLISWRKNHGFQLCGGDLVIRFRHGDEVVCLTSANMIEGLSVFMELDQLLYFGATEENRCYIEE